MLIFGMAVIAIIIILNAYLKKKYKIEKDYLPFRHYSKTQKWIERILFLAFAILLAVNYFVYGVVENYLFFGFAVLLFGYRAFMEYKYDREEKEYLLTFVWSIGLLVIFLGSIVNVQQTIAPYKEVLKEIESLTPDSVHQIEITNYAWHEKARSIYEIMEKKREIHVDDRETINQLLTEISTEELRVRDRDIKNRDSYYELNIKGDVNFEITVYEKSLFIEFGDMDNFQAVGDNGLYQMLENEQLDWVYPDGESK